MTATVGHIYRYPVKGLSPEALTETQLEERGGIPLDRAFALAQGSAPFDPADPKPLSKTHFLMLMANPRLAKLQTRFDEANGVLIIRRDGKDVARGDINTPIGRKLIEQFFGAWLEGEVRGSPRLVSAKDHCFSDVGIQLLSLINLSSVRDLERVVGAPVDPMRFRGNIYIDGLDAWREFGWVGKEVVIGDVKMRIIDRTQRCAATNVDPGKGERDMNIPRTLQKAFGHADLGVYATVVDAGRVAVGDKLTEPVDGS